MRERVLELARERGWWLRVGADGRVQSVDELTDVPDEVLACPELGGLLELESTHATLVDFGLPWPVTGTAEQGSLLVERGLLPALAERAVGDDLVLALQRSMRMLGLLVVVMPPFPEPTHRRWWLRAGDDVHAVTLPCVIPWEVEMLDVGGRPLVCRREQFKARREDV